MCKTPHSERRFALFGVYEKRYYDLKKTKRPYTLKCTALSEWGETGGNLSSRLVVRV